MTDAFEAVYVHIGRLGCPGRRELLELQIRRLGLAVLFGSKFWVRKNPNVKEMNSVLVGCPGSHERSLKRCKVVGCLASGASTGERLPGIIASINLAIYMISGDIPLIVLQTIWKPNTQLLLSLSRQEKRVNSCHVLWRYSGMVHKFWISMEFSGLAALAATPQSMPRELVRRA